MRTILEPIRRTSRQGRVLRTINGGRIDFWTLGDQNAGRSRKYRRVVVDEGAFTDDSMAMTWKKAIKPTLFDLRGRALVCSNTNGIDPGNFFWQICNQPEHGFIEYHAPTISNPTIPGIWDAADEAGIMEALGRRDLTEDEIRTALRSEEIEKLRRTEHPLVFRQEYEAEFIDWSGVAFFSLDKMLDNGLPVARPTKCDAIYCIIDTASKTGTANDGTAVIYFAFTKFPVPRLVVLDWEITQIEGALLETWLPTVLQNGEALARSCGARNGFIGAWIEDKSSGTVLLQQSARRRLPAAAIDSKLTSLGKDERAISISGYHYRSEIKLCTEAFEKTTLYKGTTRNHFIGQVTGFRIGDRDAAKRADDLLDCYAYGVAMGLGDAGGF